jgi:hypothetical protein
MKAPQCYVGLLVELAYKLPVNCSFVEHTDTLVYATIYVQ